MQLAFGAWIVGFKSIPQNYLLDREGKVIAINIYDEELVKKGSITKTEADKVLGKKVRDELAFLRTQVQGLTPKQEAACVSFIYNLGRGNFLKSTFLKKLKIKDFKAAQIECEKWVYAKGTKLNGLVKRRAAEARWLA
jgi:lysozyme